MHDTLLDATDKLRVESRAAAVFTLSGRLGRARYFAYGIAVSLCASLLLGGVFGAAALSFSFTPNDDQALASLPIYGLMAASTIILARRRLNDMDRSGWLALLLIAPGINIFFGLWLLFGEGTPDANSFGPPPPPNTRAVVAATWILPVLLLALCIGGPMLASAAPHR